MKKKIYVVLFSLIALLISTTASAQKKGARYTPREENRKQTAAAGYTGALEYYASMRNNVETGEFNYQDYINALKDVKLLGSTKASTLTWHGIGPTNQGGRVRSIIFDKTDPNVMYVGSVSGGIWKTTNAGQSWFPVNDIQESLIVSCIDQAPNGIIWYGTGEGFAPVGGTTNGSTGFVGYGLFKSTDASGTTFEHVASTDPDSDDSWEYVYKLKVHPNGNIYAATQKGIRMSNDNGATWTNPLSSFPANTAKATDVDISANGNVISLVMGNKVYLSNDGGSTFNNMSTGTGMLPLSGVSRIEVDIAPSNTAYIYAMAAKTGSTSLHNIYRTTNGGASWEIIGPGGSENFNPLGTQGYYDNVVRVHPTNPNKVFVGGLDMWAWEQGGNWEQKSLWFLSEYSDYFLHADHHKYVFHPENPDIMYFGTDGGISKSTDGGNTYQTVNRYFTTAQFYSISVGPQGQIMGGTQDNGTLLMDREGYVEGRSVPMLGGDGGYCAFSYLNPELLFASIYYGDVYRTPTGIADGMATFWDEYVQGLSTFGATSFGAFVTPLVLHEKIDDHINPDSVRFVATEDYLAGDTVEVFSSTSSYPFEYILPVNMNIDDTLMVQDMVSSKFYVGLNGMVLMTRESHQFSATPEWYKIATVSGTVQSMTVSNCGNYLFVGTTNGNIYRISNLNYANDFQSASTFLYDTVGTVVSQVTNPYQVVEVKKLTLATSGRSVNSIAVDPNNPERIVVVLGNYGYTAYVYYSSNALDAEPTFSARQGSLPRFPVYSAIIDVTNPNTVLLGTEFGIYMTTNITTAAPSWTEENDGGIARVPVYSLRQQTTWLPGVTNYGAVYAGSHGRGAFECLDFVSMPESPETHQPSASIEVYPNPAKEEITVVLPTGSNNTILKIYNISGNLVKELSVSNASSGKVKVDISSLPSGVFMIELINQENRYTGKFIKSN
jgi:hypothetical protein